MPLYAKFPIFAACNNVANKLIIITAPSGSGKTTICRHLLQLFPQLRFSISATTRSMREGEVNGKDYYFLSREEFARRIRENEFLEYEEVYAGNYYGTLRSEVERLWAEGYDVLFDIDVQGALNLKSIFGDRSLMVYIQTPVHHLEDRLRQRKSETEETLKTRLDKAASEMEFMHHADAIIQNIDLPHALMATEEAVSSFLKA